MSFIHIKKNILSDKRDIIKYLSNGDYRYKVRFRQDIQYMLYVGNTCICKFTTHSSRNSEIDFNDEKIANDYAKIASEADTYLYNDTIKMYMIGGSQFSKYGYFKGYIYGDHKSNPYIYFTFNRKYQGKLGDDLYLSKLSEFSQERAFKKIKAHIDKLDSCRTIYEYDIATMQVVPYDQIKASSSEMEELRHLVSQYKEDMQKYQDFLQKLLKNSEENAQSN